VSPITDSPYYSFSSSKIHSDLIWVYQYPNKGETKYHTFLILLLFGCYILVLFIWSICLGMLPAHIHSLMNRRVINWKLKNLMAHIYSGPRLCPGLRLRGLGYCFRGLSLRARHDTSETRLYGDLSLCAPQDTSEISTIINMTSYQYPSVSPTPVKVEYFIIYCPVIMSTVNTQ